MMTKKINFKKTKSKMKNTRQDIIFNAINYTLLIIMLFIFLYPLIFVFSASFSKPEDIFQGKMWLFPKNLYFEGYAEIFKHKAILTGYLNTVIVVFFGTLLNMVVTFTAGYALSRKDFFVRKYLMWIFIFTMFFSGGLIPTYLLNAHTLNMNNSLLVLIIPSAISVWNIILVKTYFQASLSEELLEAAKMDGCSNIRFFIQIALPLAMPIIAVIFLYNVVGRWNSYFDALIYLQDSNKYPLQLVIRNLLTQSGINSIDPNAGDIQLENIMRIEGMKYGVIVVSTLPMLILYPFIQKHFKKGVMVGSLKG